MIWYSTRGGTAQPSRYSVTNEIGTVLTDRISDVNIRHAEQNDIIVSVFDHSDFADAAAAKMVTCFL